MFDIGFSEIFVVAIVALLVLGPERLPRAARFTGLWVRRARAQWYSVKAELENELADDELKRSLAKTRDELRDIGDELQTHGRELQDDLRREGEGIEQAVKSAAATPAAAATEALEHSAPIDADAAGTDADTPDDDTTGAFDLGPREAVAAPGSEAANPARPVDSGIPSATDDGMGGDHGNRTPEARP